MPSLDRTPSARDSVRVPRDADPRNAPYVPRRYPEATRLVEIARRLGVSPTTLRQYYEARAAELRSDR